MVTQRHILGGGDGLDGRITTELCDAWDGVGRAGNNSIYGRVQSEQVSREGG
jgi:hypothetical protein